ncbi:MAG TPA: tRNA pseudouridine(13) synthase TruD [Thermoplasmata archaeon]|nr:tRNA pseudouridine(13) synthase TruD [Thermoplasmata archaeon]
MLYGPAPPPTETSLGLGFYQTASPGTGGRLKLEPEDFRVRELSLYPPPVDDGEFTVLRVVARNWEQHELAQRLASRFGLRPGSIAWAGTKDRRAITEQLLSYRGAPRPANASPLAGVDILEMYRSDRGVVLGHHFGNSFDIRVRDVAGDAADLRAQLDALAGELREARCIPNFFGLQRFGEVRPVTHLVGAALVRGDPDAAVRIYLEAETPGESAEGTAARRQFSEHQDAERALKEFPPAYRFERALLDRLSRGHDSTRALHALPRELRRLFVHAFQSRLFNEYIVRRRARAIALTEAIPGDLLLRVARDGTVPGVDPIPVGEENLTEAREMLRRERAVVAGPLVGFGTPTMTGVPGELLGGLLSDEGVAREQFNLPRTPDLASEGSYRPLALAVPPMGLEVSPRVGADGSASYRATFALPKGAYATVLLRELIKSGAIPSPTDGRERSPAASNQA